MCNGARAPAPTSVRAIDIRVPPAPRARWMDRSSPPCRVRATWALPPASSISRSTSSSAGRSASRGNLSDSRQFVGQRDLATSRCSQNRCSAAATSRASATPRTSAMSAIRSSRNSRESSIRDPSGLTKFGEAYQAWLDAGWNVIVAQREYDIAKEERDWVQDLLKKAEEALKDYMEQLDREGQCTPDPLKLRSLQDAIADLEHDLALAKKRVGAAVGALAIAEVANRKAEAALKKLWAGIKKSLKHWQVDRRYGGWESNPDDKLYGPNRKRDTYSGPYYVEDKDGVPHPLEVITHNGAPRNSPRVNWQVGETLGHVWVGLLGGWNELYVLHKHPYKDYEDPDTILYDWYECGQGNATIVPWNVPFGPTGTPGKLSRNGAVRCAAR